MSHHEVVCTNVFVIIYYVPTCSVTGAVCTRSCCSQKALKTPPIFQSSQHALISDQRHCTYSRGQETSPENMDPCDCSKSKCCLRWDLQLRRILHLHKLLLQKLQEELLPMLPIRLHQMRLWLRVQREDL
ncbi:hypothetical protein NQZ68_039404 [Dissostichus eleginoides]|nr:hypothetical protein NQZ68_039404 [Dissostichus eleginoides]